MGREASASLACFQAVGLWLWEGLRTDNQSPHFPTSCSNLPEKEEDGPRRLNALGLRDPGFQVRSKQLQQPRVQLLRFVKDEHGLVAAPPGLLHLPPQLLLHRTPGAQTSEEHGLLFPQGSGAPKPGSTPNNY